jgi:hypothetical protein
MVSSGSVTGASSSSAHKKASEEWMQVVAITTTARRKASHRLKFFFILFSPFSKKYLQVKMYFLPLYFKRVSKKPKRLTFFKNFLKNFFIFLLSSYFYVFFTFQKICAILLDYQKSF